MLRNFVRLIFGQRQETPSGESVLQSRQAKRIEAPQLPDAAAGCWRQVILGETGLPTANVPLQFLLKNNVRCVKRANHAEQVIAERIRITHSFFVWNQPLLGHEILALSDLEAEGS